MAVLFVLAAVTSAQTLAWISPCAAHAEVEEDGCCAGEAARAGDAEDDPIARANGALTQGEDDDGARCSCPVACGSCCASAPSSCAVTVPAAAPTAILAYSLLTFVPSVDLQGDGAPFDILHVPRS